MWESAWDSRFLYGLVELFFKVRVPLIFHKVNSVLKKVEIEAIQCRKEKERVNRIFVEWVVIFETHLNWRNFNAFMILGLNM